MSLKRNNAKTRDDEWRDETRELKARKRGRGNQEEEI